MARPYASASTLVRVCSALVAAVAVAAFVGVTAQRAGGPDRPGFAGQTCGETAVNPSNCGACGVVCEKGQRCRAGVCATIATENERPPDPIDVLPTAIQHTWYERGPELGGRLDAIVDITDNRLLVASPGGGVWRSPNGAASWAFPLNYGYGDYSAVHLERDRINAARSFVVTWNGLYATSSGDSFTALINSGGVPAPLFPGLGVADPKPFAQLVFSLTERAVFASPPCRGLRYSLTGSPPFSQATGAAGPGTCITDIAADPGSGRVFFATFSYLPPQVYRSNCNGVIWSPATTCDTWELINTGLPNGSRVVALAFIGGGVRAQYDLVAAVKTGAETSMYGVSGGTPAPVWQFLSSIGSPSWDPRPLVATGAGRELFHGNVLPHHTLDPSTVWETLTGGVPHPDVRGIYPDPNAGYVWMTTDGAVNSGLYGNVMRWPWTPGSPIAPGTGVNMGHAGLTVWQAYYAGVVESSKSGEPSRRVFLGSQDNAAVCSDTLGVGAGAWTDQGAPPGGGSGDLFAIQFSRTYPNVAYARSQAGETFDVTYTAGSAPNCRGVLWYTRTPIHEPDGFVLDPPRYWSRNTMALHPSDPNWLYFALSNRIALSRNAGALTPTFKHFYVPAGPPDNASPTAIYVDAAKNIYVGTLGKGAYKCADPAASDTALTCTPWGLNGPSPAPPALITAITQPEGSVFPFWMATTDGLYKGTDAGDGTVTWTLSTGGNGYLVSDVEIDPNCPTRVYAAFGFGYIYAQHRGGIRVSANNGMTWQSITSGTALHQGPVTDVEVDPVNSNAVYAASYGRGFWVYGWDKRLPACRR